MPVDASRIVVASGRGPEPGPHPLFLVLNAASGRGDVTQRHDTIVRVLGEAGRAFDIEVVTEPGALAAAAARAVERALRCDGAVVAAGGDGTLNAVARAVLGSGRPFGILPQGTFNYFGRAHGVPTELEPALRALLGARVRPVRVGLVDDRIFLVNASVGLYPDLLQDREAWKRRYGRSRPVALLAAIATILRGGSALHLTLETAGSVRTVRMLTLFVGNNPLQFERLGLPIGEAVGEGRLAAVLVPPLGPLALLGLALRGAFGELGDASTLQRIEAHRLDVQPSRLRLRRLRRVSVATDGEVFRLALPLRFSVAPEPLWLLAPAPDDAGPHA